MGISSEPSLVLRYRLTPADVLAFERLPGEYGWRGKLALFGGPFVVGLLAALFDDWSPFLWWTGVLVLMLAWYGLCVAIHNLLIHGRAKAMARREGRTEVEDLPDRLVVMSGSGRREIPFDQVGKVLVEDGHVFVLCVEGPLIIPLRAFADREQMRRFGVDLDRRSEGAVP